MFIPRLAFSVVLLLASAGWSYGAEAVPPRSASASPDPCTSAVPELSNDLLTAFAFDLESPPLLHFISALVAVPQRRRTQLFNTVADTASSKPEQAVEAAVGATCPNLDEIYATSRATILLVNEWKLREFEDAKRFDDFSAVVATAIAALSLGDRLAPDQQNTAMQPFMSFLPTVTPTPSPATSPQAICSTPDAAAHTVHIVEPEYPPFAVSAGLSGTATMKIALSETGDVRSVRVFGNTLHNGDGARDIVRASVFSAAATTYTPAMRNCMPVASTYLFRAEYRRR